LLCHHAMTTQQIVALAAVGATLSYCAYRIGAVGRRAVVSGYAPPRILLLGDSITQQSFSVGGWGMRLADHYQRRADVINRGFSGYNTRWALRLLDGPQLRDVADRTVLVIIFFGANDASLPEHNLRQFVPLDEFVANTRTIVEHLRAHCPSAAIILMAPPPVDHKKRLAFQRQRYPNSASGILERTNENTGVYAEAVADLAKELGLPCVQLWEAMQAAAPNSWDSFLSDGLHLSADGNEKVAELLLATIAETYPKLAVKTDPTTGNVGNSATRCAGLTPNGPFHDQIDTEDLAASFRSMST